MFVLEFFQFLFQQFVAILHICRIDIDELANIPFVVSNYKGSGFIIGHYLQRKGYIPFQIGVQVFERLYQQLGPILLLHAQLLRQLVGIIQCGRHYYEGCEY